MKNLIYLLLSGCLVCASFKKVDQSYYKQTASFPDTVRIASGLISGLKVSDGDVTIFKGIPFAAPPVGELRWKAPQPVTPWQGVKSCVAFGPNPMQPKPRAFSMWSEEFFIPAGSPISEDCLYLNIWTGSTSQKEKRPVLVWIYGGGFNSGGGSVPIYDGEAMAKKGIVFVSINYRVGMFGFFAHPDLSKESGKNASGNYGLMDQLAALQWVQRNISAFGGDAGNVTIAGQSAGSMSVNYLVASPLAKGLFKKAIAESGANFSRGGITLQQAEEDGVKLAQTLKASSVADLRKIPAEELLKARTTGRPNIDGYFIPDAIANIFASGKQNNVTLLTSWNENEGLLSGPTKSAADFRKQAEEQYGADAPTFLQFYPASTDEEAAASQLKLGRDMIFGVQNFTWANVESSQGKKVYVYRFTRKVPAIGEYVKYGAFHTGEVPYAYDNLKFVNRPWHPVDYQIAKNLSTYWANFIATGDPNGKGLPHWPTYTIADKQIMMLDTIPEAKQLPDIAPLEFLHAKMSGK
jgi:para-nitrobenzyl esterase